MKMECYWYHHSLTLLSILLWPFACVFRFIVMIRFYLYYFKLKKIIHFPVPIIVVGNLTVGGTGKTPLVIGLAHFLTAQGFNPGIVSRGIGGKKQFSPQWVDAHTDPHRVGEEAVLLARRSHCPVVISIDRVAAVKELLANTVCNVVITDDGLQHYRLGRDIEIAVIDGDRGLGNRCLLPAGPLRESPSRLKRVDFIVQQGGACHKDYFSLHLDGDVLVSIKDPQIRMPLESLRNTPVHAIAGIGNPQRFFSTLRHYGLDIIEHIFSDHHLYQATDFNFSEQLPFIMTEKDAVKCTPFANERFWYLPVSAKLEPAFTEKLLVKLLAVLNKGK
jgi:tetraacyldisaccharide 4'-kinase